MHVYLNIHIYIQKSIIYIYINIKQEPMYNQCLILVLEAMRKTITYPYIYIYVGGAP